MQSDVDCVVVVYPRGLPPPWVCGCIEETTLPGLHVPHSCSMLRWGHCEDAWLIRNPNLGAPALCQEASTDAMCVFLTRVHELLSPRVAIPSRRGDARWRRCRSFAAQAAPSGCYACIPRNTLLSSPSCLGCMSYVSVHALSVLLSMRMRDHRHSLLGRTIRMFF